MATYANNQYHEGNQYSESASSEDGGMFSDPNEELHRGKNVAEVPLEIRHGFVKKVYSILVVMLIITSLVAAPFQFLTLDQVQSNESLIQVMLIGSLVITLAMVCCCSGALKTYPYNYVFILIISVLYGIIIGCVAMQYQAQSVILAAGITSGIFFALTCYACFTKTDFTGFGIYLHCALYGLILMSFMGFFIMMFFPGAYDTFRMIKAGFGAILFSFFIIYDTQLIMGGKHAKQQFSIDDYALAALNLYLDIINLFMYMLQLMGDRK